MRMLALALLGATTVLVSTTASAQAPTPIPAPPNVAAPPATASKSASGLVSMVVTPGTGTVHPGPADIVTVHATGWTPDGKMFGTTRQGTGQPATFPLDSALAGWAEGVQQMVAGETRRLWVPESLAYKGRAPRGLVVFDVELVSFRQMPTVPPDVKAIPDDATRTASGLAYRALTAGRGTQHPSARSEVTVHYTGWTTDGKMFDSSLTRGEPATFQLGDVIAGWTEGLQLMVPGQKMRFWIPQDLAYQGKSAPYGMLVFDVELISAR